MREIDKRFHGVAAPTDGRKWRRKLREITKLLVAEYGVPTLGNFRDPVKEIFYIVLSAKTTESHYRRANQNLWKRFPTLHAISIARIADLRRCIDIAGLGRKRAPQIKMIARRLCKDFGKSPTRALKQLTAIEAFDYLHSLPGVGPKSALCIMMYSLDFDVFPVDTHVQRILCRVGAIKEGAKHYQAQAVLPALVPVGLSKCLHVTLIRHGRTICRAHQPLCDFCRIRRLCDFGRSMR